MDNIYEFSIKKFLGSGKELPDDLKRLVEKFQKAGILLSAQPEEVKQRLAPILVKSAAIIAVELQDKFESSPDKDRIDKRKKLELEAKAIELLQKQYRMKV